MSDNERDQIGRDSAGAESAPCWVPLAPSAIEPPDERAAAERKAEALEEVLFRLYDAANRPDIVWTEDGPEYGDTYDEAEDPQLAAEIAEAEKRLNLHLTAHRAELAGHDRWKGYYPDLDARGEPTPNDPTQ